MSAIEKQGNGIMVGYFFDESMREVLGSSESDPHITMAYLGKSDEVDRDSIEAVKVALAGIGKRFSSLAGKLDGIARFSATPSSDNMDVLVRLVNVPYLEDLRGDVCKALDLLGAPAKRNHGYVPHSTLAYIDPDSEQALKAEPIPISIDRITLAVSGKHYDFPLTGSAPVMKIASPKPFVIRDGEIAKQWQIPIEKIDEDLRQIFGWASVASVDGKPVIDYQGDIIGEDDLEKMAYDFVLESRLGDEMHKSTPVATLIESMVFTAEKQKALGVDLKKVGWFVGFQIHDDAAWKAVKDGTYKAFSIGGRAKREEIAA